MADTFRLFRRIAYDAIPLLEKMLEDDDDSVLAAASATAGDLRFLFDNNMWADKILELCSHSSTVVRRNIVHTIRDYMEEFKDDSRGIIPKLWKDGDEVVLTRLKELLIMIRLMLIVCIHHKIV